MKPDISEFTVSKISMVNSKNPNFLAKADIAIGNWLEIKGFKIIRSKFPDTQVQPLCVYPPSVPAYGKPLNIIFVTDKDLWKQITELIIERFNAELDAVEFWNEPMS